MIIGCPFIFTWQKRINSCSNIVPPKKMNLVFMKVIKILLMDNSILLALNACVVSVMGQKISPELFSLFAADVKRLTDGRAGAEFDLIEKIKIIIISLEYELKRNAEGVCAHNFDRFLGSLPDELRRICAY